MQRSSDIGSSMCSDSHSLRHYVSPKSLFRVLTSKLCSIPTRRINMTLNMADRTAQ